MSRGKYKKERNLKAKFRSMQWFDVKQGKGLTHKKHEGSKAKGHTQ